ncbi:MAG: acyl-CoA synthetase [Acidimicrobiia bacterium]|nr:MAG: acyl-CoA synthetase [Acidimicrobiia bacterium]
MPPEPVLGPSAHATATPGKPAFVEGERVLTYGELERRTDRIAHALAGRGVSAGDRVAIMLPNSIGFFEAWAAATKLRASVVLVNTHLKADEVRYILDDSGARVLLDDLDALEEMAAGDARAPVDLAPCEVLTAPVFYTSGTTGRPKGVVHGSFDGDRARLAQQGQVALWGWTDADVYLLSGPAYHAGPGGFVMSALFVGATTVILPRWDAREWLRLVDRHRVTLSFMTPAHFIRILEVPAAERAAFDTSSLRLVVHGAAPCPVEVKRRIIEALPHTAIWELYGASEGGATRISPQEWLERPGSVGLPWPGVEVRILDEHGEPRPPGEPGLVYVKPAGGARFHYHDDDAKTREAWRGDAFTVGDIGYLDDDGYLYLTDRASDMVIRGGVNVYPREIEEVLHRHPAVVDCAVFGVPDERYGEQLEAVVEVRAEVGTRELQAFVREHLADYKVPAYVEIVDELPRSPNGKVMKRWLREQAWEGRDRRIG